MLRDRLLARLADVPGTPDYVKLVEEVLGIRNASPALARRLIAQALVIEDRREEWARTGARLCRAAPTGPGVYVLRAASVPLYVGKANHLQRRLRSHFVPRRWKAIPPDLARVTDADWFEVGSELEALLREADLIRTLQPKVNTQIGPPSMAHRTVPAKLVEDLIVVLPSIDPASVELIAARATGGAAIQRVRRDRSDLSARVDEIWTFFRNRLDAARFDSPLVFSWLAGRGATATRLETRDLASPRDVVARLTTALRSSQLFQERLVLR